MIWKKPLCVPSCLHLSVFLSLCLYALKVYSTVYNLKPIALLLNQLSMDY